MKLPLLPFLALSAWLQLPQAPLLPKPPSVDVLVQTIDHRYNSLKTLQADFVEISTSESQSETGSGTLYLHKPGQMRWVYKVPKPMLFLVDGKFVWQYFDGDPQVERTPVKETDDLRTPLRFLLGHTDLKREMNDLGYGEMNPLTAGNLVLHGRPHQDVAGWREVFFEVTPDGKITRIVVGQDDGSQTDLRLSHQQTDLALAPSLFQFTPPPGVTIVPGAGGER